MTQQMLSLFQTALSPMTGFMSSPERTKQGRNTGDLGQVLLRKTTYAEKGTRATQEQKQSNLTMDKGIEQTFL